VDDENSTSSTNSGSVLPTAPFSPGEALVYRTLADGTYYARVSISPGANTVNGSGDYLLSISRNGFIGSCGCNNPPALSKVAITSPTYQNGPATLSGSIIDYDLAQWHQVTVNWGDGSSITTTNLPPGANLFHIPHTYLKANANVSISLAMQDDAGGAASTNITVTVQPQPMTPQLLSITQSAVDGHIVLALQGSPGIAYRVQTSNDLIVWTELNSSTADANGFFQIEDTTLPLLVQRFYRALWP